MKDLSAALQLLIVGFYVPLSLLLPTGVGLWFDRRASHEFPLCTLIGLGLGTVIMVYGVYRMVRPFLHETERDGKEDQVSPPILSGVDLLRSRKKKVRGEK